MDSMNDRFFEIIFRNIVITKTDLRIRRSIYRLHNSNDGILKIWIWRTNRLSAINQTENQQNGSLGAYFDPSKPEAGMTDITRENLKARMMGGTGEDAPGAYYPVMVDSLTTRTAIKVFLDTYGSVASHRFSLEALYAWDFTGVEFDGLFISAFDYQHQREKGENRDIQPVINPVCTQTSSVGLYASWPIDSWWISGTFFLEYDSTSPHWSRCWLIFAVTAIKFHYKPSNRIMNQDYQMRAHFCVENERNELFYSKTGTWGCSSIRSVIRYNYDTITVLSGLLTLKVWSYVIALMTLTRHGEGLGEPDLSVMIIWRNHSLTTGVSRKTRMTHGKPKDVCNRRQIMFHRFLFVPFRLMKDINYALLFWTQVRRLRHFSDENPIGCANLMRKSDLWYVWWRWMAAFTRSQACPGRVDHDSCIEVMRFSKTYQLIKR